MPEKKVNFRTDEQIEKGLKTPVKMRSYNPWQVDDLADCFKCDNRVKPKCSMGFKLYSKDECSLSQMDGRYCEGCDHYSKTACSIGYPFSSEIMSCDGYKGPKVIVEIFFSDNKGNIHTLAKTK